MTPTVAWGPILAAFIAVAGWLVNEFLSSRRDLRKELRAEVDLLLEALEIMEQDAVDFHTAIAGSAASKVKILRGLTRIGRSLPRLRAKGLTRLKAEQAMMQVRRAITLENFDSDFVTRAPDDKILADVMAAVGELHDQIEDAYSDRYTVWPSAVWLSVMKASAVIVCLAAIAIFFLWSVLSSG